MDGLAGPDTAHGELRYDSAILFATCVVLRRRAKKRKLVALLASTTEHPGEGEGTEDDPRPGSEDPDGLERADAPE